MVTARAARRRRAHGRRRRARRRGCGRGRTTRRTRTPASTSSSRPTPVRRHSWSFNAASWARPPRATRPGRRGLERRSLGRRQLGRARAVEPSGEHGPTASWAERELEPTRPGQTPAWTEATDRRVGDAATGTGGASRRRPPIGSIRHGARQLSPNGGCRAPTPYGVRSVEPPGSAIPADLRQGAERGERQGSDEGSRSDSRLCDASDHRARTRSCSRRPGHRSTRCTSGADGESLSQVARALHAARARSALPRSRCRSSAGSRARRTGSRSPSSRPPRRSRSSSRCSTPRNQSYHTTIVFLVAGGAAPAARAARCSCSLVQTFPEWLKERYPLAHPDLQHLRTTRSTSLAAWGAAQLILEHGGWIANPTPALRGRRARRVRRASSRVNHVARSR